MDSEQYNVPVGVAERGRKRKRDERPPSRQKSRKYTSQGKVPTIDCPHIASVKRGCCASTLSTKDAQYFFETLHKEGGKYAQDKYLLKHMSVSNPKRNRKRKEDSKRSRPVQVKYSIYTLHRPSVSVCAQAFQSITCTSRDRLARLARTFKANGASPRERRGGMDLARRESHMKITESIVKHIGQYKCRESHYGRAKSVRHYLSPELSVKQMWRQWKSHQEKRCSYRKFHNIFMTKFNLGFGNPRTDICSFCEEQNRKLQLATEENEKKTLMLDKRLHKLRAKKFYAHLKSDPPESITVVFDCQQNQPLPKLSVSDTFYSRQVWLYNLTCMVYHGSRDVGKEEYITFYTWLETQHGRGSNEIASALLHYLQDLEDKIPSDINTVRLFSDSAASQNKNVSVLAALCGYLKSSTRWKKIHHYFPIRGHSYMPPDRVFGRVEKDLRKKEVIVSPTEYYKILQQHGNVLICGTDWKVKDYKTVAHSRCRTPLPFKISEQKVITYSKVNHNVRISVRTLYDWGETFCSVLKRGQTWMDFFESLNNISPASKVSKEKANDVKKLMKYFAMPPDADDFYKSVLMSDNRAEMDSNIVVYDADEPPH